MNSTTYSRTNYWIKINNFLGLTRIFSLFTPLKIIFGPQFFYGLVMNWKFYDELVYKKFFDLQCTEWSDSSRFKKEGIFQCTKCFVWVNTCLFSAIRSSTLSFSLSSTRLVFINRAAISSIWGENLGNRNWSLLLFLTRQTN